MGNLRKAKSQYTNRQHEYEKARDLANKAEIESPAQSQGGPSVAAQVNQREPIKLVNIEEYLHLIH